MPLALHELGRRRSNRSGPKRQLSLIPEAVGFDQASTVAIGAIAMQGVRRAQPTLGETFVVIGLGILGQLASQLLVGSPAGGTIYFGFAEQFDG